MPTQLPPIPDKLQFKIGEVSRLVGVKPYVLRFWEREFARVHPVKAPNGHRVYSRADVEILRRVRLLLHDRRYTIAGAQALFAEGDEAVLLALAATPNAAAAELDDATERINELEAALHREQERVASLRREVAAAEAEAAFWRSEVQTAEAVAERLMGRLRNAALALRADAGAPLDS